MAKGPRKLLTYQVCQPGIYRGVLQIRPPFCNTKHRGGLICDIFSHDYALPRSKNVGAVLWMLASFLHCHSTTETLNLTSFDEGGGGLMHRRKIPLQDFVLKMQGGLCARGGIFAEHYGTQNFSIHVCVYACSSQFCEYPNLATLCVPECQNSVQYTITSTCMYVHTSNCRNSNLSNQS